MPRISFLAGCLPQLRGRRIFSAVAVLGLLAAGLGVPAGGAATRFATGPTVTRTTLRNGLRVVVVENHALPLAQVAMWYRFGSAGDPPGRAGVAHALEHMMFRGTHALSGTALDLVTARFGMDVNAETDHEYTHYYQTGPVDAVPLALDIEADRMRGLRLDPRDWNLERQAVLAELADSDWSDAGNLEDDVRRIAFGTSPLRHDPGGSPAEVRRISVSDLRRAYDAGYQPSNATLVVTGDVDPRVIFGLAQADFGSIRGRPAVQLPSSEPIVARGFSLRRRALTSNVVDIALESRGEAAPGSAEEVAIELLQSWHAVLPELIVDHGPCSSYDADVDLQLHGGLIHVLCYLNYRTSAGDAIRRLRRAFRRLDAHVTSRDIAYARRTDVAETRYTDDSLTDEADLFGETIADQNTDPRLFDLETASVSDAAVRAVLRRWTTPVGFGAAVGARGYRSEPHPRKPRSERVAPAPLEAIVAPPWARALPGPLRTPRTPRVETFVLPSGVRLFVAPRHGNETVYVRGGFDDPDEFGFASATVRRVAEQHAILIDSDNELNMHGFAHDLPLMISFVADMLRPDESGIPVRNGPLRRRLRRKSGSL